MNQSISIFPVHIHTATKLNQGQFTHFSQLESASFGIKSSYCYSRVS
jgi:hypothetical protein